MARRTFFSFHYKPDVTRAWVVRNSWVTKVAQGDRDDAGFFDSSVFEASQRESDDSLKRFLREGLNNTTVTCILVGRKPVFGDGCAMNSSVVSFVVMVSWQYEFIPSVHCTARLPLAVSTRSVALPSRLITIQSASRST